MNSLFGCDSSFVDVLALQEEEGVVEDEKPCEGYFERSLENVQWMRRILKTMSRTLRTKIP